MRSLTPTTPLKMPFSKILTARRTLSAGIFAAAVMASPAHAADDVVYNFFYDSVISIGKPNTSPPPVLGQPVVTATFKDLDSGQVSLNIATNFSDAANFIDQIGFNFTGSPNFSIAGCTQTQVPSSDIGLCASGVTTLAFNQDGTNVAGGGNLAKGFDFLVDLPPPPGEDGNPGPFRLGGQGESITLTFTNADNNLAASQFFAKTAKGYYTSAHIQGLTNGGSTNIVGTPPGTDPPPPAPGDSVPGPLPLLGAAAAFGYSRKLRTRIGAYQPLKRSPTA